MQSSRSKNNFLYFNTYTLLPKREVLIPIVITVLIIFNISACHKREAVEISHSPNQIKISPNALNINSASLSELEKLPHVGKETARHIILFREKHGNFRRPENLILVDGINDQKFREIRHLIKVE